MSSSLRKELHEIRTKNIGLRDNFNKMSVHNNEAQEEIKKIKLENETIIQASLKNYQQFKKIDQLLAKREAELKKANVLVKKLTKKNSKLIIGLTDTLNVKLRYEQIIKNLFENEKTGHQKTV